VQQNQKVTNYDGYIKNVQRQDDIQAFKEVKEEERKSYRK